MSEQQISEAGLEAIRRLRIEVQEWEALRISYPLPKCVCTHEDALICMKWPVDGKDGCQCYCHNMCDERDRVKPL